MSPQLVVGAIRRFTSELMVRDFTLARERFKAGGRQA